MSFVFYDTETTGTHASFDQIVQFAAIGTDSDLNEIERFEIRCRLLPHVIPAPRALLTTGVTPELLLDASLPSHYHAICKIADKLECWSPATFLGYNSMEFDERLLRQAFYQNLKPIYLTNTNGNRRADILKLVDAAIVFAPNSFVVPV
jgi:exodeoxyribonuclease-1